MWLCAVEYRVRTLSRLSRWTHRVKLKFVRRHGVREKESCRWQKTGKAKIVDNFLRGSTVKAGYEGINFGK